MCFSTVPLNSPIGSVYTLSMDVEEYIIAVNIDIARVRGDNAIL